MNKQEFVEKLKMHGAWCTECHDINGEKDRYVKVAKVRELLEQLNEPLNALAQEYDVEPETIREWLNKGHKGSFEKVVVTEEEIAMIKIGKKSDMSVYGFLYSVLPMEKAYDDRLAKAYLYGYTVKPKRWVVRHEAGKFFEKFTGNGTSRAWVVWKNQAYIFTDKSKAEAVATLVEGSVEEI